MSSIKKKGITCVREDKVFSPDTGEIRLSELSACFVHAEELEFAGARKELVRGGGLGQGQKSGCEDGGDMHGWLALAMVLDRLIGKPRGRRGISDAGGIDKYFD